MVPPIIPAPASVCLLKKAAFKLSATTPIVQASSGGRAGAVARQLAQYLGLEQIKEYVPGAITLQLDTALKATLGNEGYRLTCLRSGIAIIAATARGLFYGTQSLRQLLPPQTERLGVGAAPVIEIPAMQIEDKPRFGWRGLMLDCSRHMLSVEELKRFLDMMALHKLNTLHWHLVDDQGWRIQIRKYPKLTEVGGWRSQSPCIGDRKKGDGTPYGGYYTQAQIREVVAYARERFITVVPEIELPGHASAAIAAYPGLGNRDIPGYAPQVKEFWGIHPYTYAPSPQVFNFLAEVFAEVVELFPSTYIHIGGDEALKDQWQQSAFAQSVMRKHGLTDEYQLQAWFIRQIKTILDGHGRRLIGWDEISEGGLADGSTMMVWRDPKWAKFAIDQGCDVVMSPTAHCYLDYYQGDPATEPEAIGGHLPLETVYSFEPVPASITAQQQRHVLGVQGNLWSEYLPDAKQVEYMAFPRLCALAEVGWSPPARKDFKQFRTRLSHLLARFDVIGIHYRPLD